MGYWGYCVPVMHSSWLILRYNLYELVGKISQMAPPNSKPLKGHELLKALLHFVQVFWLHRTCVEQLEGWQLPI